MLLPTGHLLPAPGIAALLQGEALLAMVQSQLLIHLLMTMVEGVLFPHLPEKNEAQQEQ